MTQHRRLHVDLALVDTVLSSSSSSMRELANTDPKALRKFVPVVCRLSVDSTQRSLASGGAAFVTLDAAARFSCAR